MLALDSPFDSFLVRAIPADLIIDTAFRHVKCQTSLGLLDLIQGSARQMTKLLQSLQVSLPAFPYTELNVCQVLAVVSSLDIHESSLLLWLLWTKISKVRLFGNYAAS